MLTITRRSSLSGTFQTMTLPITNLDLLRWQQGEITLADIQPPLSVAAQRFLQHGVPPEEDAAFATLGE